MPMPERSAEGLSEGIDPVAFSVIMSRLDAIVDEMTLTIEHTARTSILAIARDYSCAIYDADSRQLCMYDAIPIHTMSLHLVLREINRDFGGELAEGDVYICNSPYRGNTHNADLVMARPVFVEGRHMFWAVTKAHQLDVGAHKPSSIVPRARDVWQEGLHIPPLKLCERGRMRDDVVNLYLANVRYSRLLKGDLLAQLGSVGIGATRLEELATDYGPDMLATYVEELLAYADRMMKAEVEAIPDGRYEAIGWVDSVAVGEERNIPIKVSVTVDGDRVKVDYSGSAPQVASSINCTIAATQGCGAIPFLCYIDSAVPHNEGCIRHIDVVAPEGSICNATYPASSHGSTQTPADCMVEIINLALAEVLPEWVMAGSSRTNNIPQIAGISGEGEEEWAVMLFNGAGGGGAAAGSDGWPIYVSPVSMGAIKAHPVEQLELTTPLFVEEMEAETDSMGLGTWIGGPGVRFALTIRSGEAEVITFGDGFDNPPHGICGGTRAVGGGQYIEDVNGNRRVFMSALAEYRLAPGMRRVGISTGGGGFGDPLSRDIEQVRRDVRDGLVSRERAREVFGVVLSEDWDPVVDQEATEMERSRLRQLRRPLYEPDRPGAADWLARQLGGSDEFVLHPDLDAGLPVLG